MYITEEDRNEKESMDDPFSSFKCGNDRCDLRDPYDEEGRLQLLQGRMLRRFLQLMTGMIRSGETRKDPVQNYADH